MAAQHPQANDLTTLTLDAVRALLREIATGTASDVGGASHPTGGTYASASAQALRDLVQCEPLALIVMDAVQKER